MPQALLQSFIFLFFSPPKRCFFFALESKRPEGRLFVDFFQHQNLIKPDRLAAANGTIANLLQLDDFEADLIDLLLREFIGFDFRQLYSRLIMLACGRL